MECVLAVKFEDGEYIILKTNPAVKKTPFSENTLSVSIKSNNDYIIKDQFFNGGKYFYNKKYFLKMKYS